MPALELPHHRRLADLPLLQGAELRAPQAFPERIRNLLKRSAEVRIETDAGAGRPKRRTVIWVVLNKEGVFVRSYRGRRGRWYKAVLRTPSAALIIGKRWLPVWAWPETDRGVRRRVTRSFRRKYGKRWPEETEAMVKRTAVQTTLRILPRVAGVPLPS